jgi:Bardet-Biedl syndrome 9 protein
MGSLFKLRDLWYHRYADEEFDVRSMAIGNVDNETPANDKIVIGSFQGMLRVLYPKKKGYQAEDVMLELNIGFPILQVAVGNFTPNVRGISIAVLTPRKLIVGSIVRVQRGGSSGNESAEHTETTDLFAKQCDFRREFEHQLDRTAFNFCFGAFGGSGSGDQVAVQSMDGQIAFYDHNKHNFSRFLPSTSFLCPGPFQYVKTRDAFVLSTSTFEVEFYRFQNLASSTASETKEGTQGRKLTPDWRFNIGEDAQEIVVTNVTPSLSKEQVDIVVVAEHTLFCLADDGEMRWNRRIDYMPSCAYAYNPGDRRKNPANVLVGTHGHSLIVMSHEKVLWSARGNCTPLQVALMSANQTNGMIAVLGDDSSISVNYLGTDPANNPVQVLESKELDYDAMDEEHKRLRVAIQQAVNQGRTEPRDQLHLTVDASQPPGADRSVQVIVRMSYRGGADLEGLVVTVNCQDPLIAYQPTTFVPYLSQGQTHEIPVRIAVNPNQERFLPVSLMCEAVVCYTTPGDEPVTAKQSFLIPLGVVGGPVEAVKNTQYALSISTNRDQAVSIAALFDDLAQRSSHVGTNVLTFQYCNGADATIIASTKGGRYKVQSSTFEAMWLIASELVRRIKGAYRGQTDLVIEFTDPIPLKDFFSVIDRHFAARKLLQDSQQHLGELAQQFRAVQKRLLVRFRERNPTPIASLELLFEETYRLLHDKAEVVATLQRDLAGYSNALSCATQIILLVSRYKFMEIMSAEDFDAFRHFLSPSVHLNPTFGWEEATDAAMVYLLRTVLSKNARESATAPQPLQIPENTEKLQRHITLVLDRIGKGMGGIAEAVAGSKDRASKDNQFQVTDKQRQ